jgi:thymidylate synthase (FAD)
MGETNLNVKLLRFTSEPEIAAATAANLCYSSANIEGLTQKMDAERAKKLIEKIVKMGHESVLEHAYFTFGVEGVSRALTHQLVRHRIASYSHQSQRYVKADDFDYVIPPSIKNDTEKKKKFEEVMVQLNKAYAEMREIAPKEDARFVLPNAAETKIIVTMNARALLNFFEKRCCYRAQWEIRALADKMLAECKDVAPTIFAKAGPSCISKGVCYEGEMSCGLYKTVGAVLK